MTFPSLLYLLIISIFLGRHFRWYLCRLYLPYISVRNINICKGNIIVIKKWISFSWKTSGNNNWNTWNDYQRMHSSSKGRDRRSCVPLKGKSWKKCLNTEICRVGSRNLSSTCWIVGEVCHTYLHLNSPIYGFSINC